MKGFIKRLLREGLLDEVSDELYAKIKSEYHNDRIIVSKDESLSFDVNTIGTLHAIKTHCETNKIIFSNQIKFNNH